MKKILSTFLLISFGFSSEFVDMKTNIMSDCCPYCKTDVTTYQNLRKEGFDFPLIGHCYGVTLFFIKYLKEHPYKLLDHPAQILNDFKSDREFYRLSHTFQFLQHTYAINSDHENALEYQEKNMKKFFSALSRSPVKKYYFISKQTSDEKLSDVELSKFISQEENSFVMIGLVDANQNRNCVAFSLHHEKLFFYDCNQGLTAFENLEELKNFAVGFFEKNKFLFAATF